MRGSSLLKKKIFVKPLGTGTENLMEDNAGGDRMGSMKARNYIKGEFREENDAQYLPIYNPSTGELIGEVPNTPDKAVEKAISAAREAFKEWRKVSMGRKMEYLFKLHDELSAQKEDLAQLIATDQGKNIHDARGEMARAIQLTETACAIPMMMR